MVAVTSKEDAPRRSLINLRVTPRDRDLIDRAAAALGKDRSEFMMEASRQAAEGGYCSADLERAGRLSGFELQPSVAGHWHQASRRQHLPHRNAGAVKIALDW